MFDFDEMQTYRCPACKDILLIVLPGCEVDEQEFKTKVSSHEAKHKEFEEQFNAN